MKNLKKIHLALIAVAVLILTGCIGMTVCMLFSNYQNIRLFSRAQSNFQRGDDESLLAAENQLLQLIRVDADNETAYIMLGEIAGKRKNYQALVYYSYMAHRLNPLSVENKARYINSLCFARYFDRLENFLSQQSNLSDREEQILFYAAGHNGSINKYKYKDSRAGKVEKLSDLARLIFKSGDMPAAEKLALLPEYDPTAEDTFMQQEILAARTELYLASNDVKNAGKTLQQAYELNEFAFAPVLGRFYANYNSFGKALEVFEKYLALYHEPTVAMQTAEIYCLLDQTEKIASLRNEFQSDAGDIAMLCNYYLDALIKLKQNDMDALKELTAPLRNRLETPLAAFMFFCVDLQGSSLAEIQESYTNLIDRPNYLDLQRRADDMLANYLKKSFRSSSPEQLYALADKLYRRKPEAFTAKLILLASKKNSSITHSMMQDALKRFSNDHGIVKIAIEYYLENDLSQCSRWIEIYKKSFPGQAGDVLRYEIVLAGRKQDFDRVSELFQKNFSPEFLPEYWSFASSTMREDDLRFIAQDKLYAPFAAALLALKNGDKKTACDLLEKAEAPGNQPLLFLAAKTLAENGRNKSALEKYALIPPNSPYRLAVLMNMAELYAENGNLANALELSCQAYKLAPELPETQLCYADKLYKNGNLSNIPDVIKFTRSSSHRRKLKELWIAGMQARLQTYDINTQQEKIRETCRQLLMAAPGNTQAAELLKKLDKMPQ